MKSRATRFHLALIGRTFGVDAYDLITDDTTEGIIRFETLKWCALTLYEVEHAMEAEVEVKVGKKSEWVKKWSMDDLLADDFNPADPKWDDPARLKARLREKQAQRGGSRRRTSREPASGPVTAATDATMVRPEDLV